MATPDTLDHLVNETRSLVVGSLPDDLSVLSDPYTPGDGSINLRYPKKNLAPGSFMSVGLNTFYVLTNAGDGSIIEVLPSMDGGPDEVAASGTIVRCKPRFTNWMIFNQLQAEIHSMSSPLTGLYGVKSFEASVDWANGTYPLPDDFGDVIRLLQGHYQIAGTDQWYPLTGMDYQPQQRLVRMVGAAAMNALRVQFTFAIPFTEPDTLTQTVTELGIPPEMADIPTLGAAAQMSLGNEGRRNQTFSQGDARRPMEVQMGANTSVFRSFSQLKQERVNEELARLTALYGWTIQSAVQSPTAGGYYNYGGNWQGLT